MGSSSSALAWSSVFEAKLVHASFARNEDKPLGLRLEHDSNGVLVRGILPETTVSAWNEQNSSLQVLPGDRVVSVNGVEVDPSWTCWCSILSELRKDTVNIVTSRGRAEDLLQLELPPAKGEAVDQLLPANFLDSMTIHTAAECEGAECCICLEYLETDTVVQLPCNHTFHRRCAETWLAKCPTFRFAKCPVCRQQVLTPPCKAPEIPMRNNFRAGEQGRDDQPTW
eukprot:CAMPEP_0172715986 /NCGR_PEP_ID=MMETSP1074-20121228/67860_1 /TAXON_ID=2916 /ORGANISM="Ceratium fusus, Strain PA161109" /LENGTH=225 /DNA_ID=CAMNT_0013540619 /DNA_START=59 /DNA_END=733 /DNA_ORIENTATION=+